MATPKKSIAFKKATPKSKKYFPKKGAPGLINKTASNSSGLTGQSVCPTCGQPM